MSVLGSLASYLFGPDQIDNSNQLQQEKLLQKQAADYASRENQDYLRQLEYGRMLTDQIKGIGAPSVAQRQLVAGEDQINRTARSAVAGATGNGAALANYGALLSAGDVAARTNQQAATLRAEETQSAQNQIGALDANMGARSSANYGTALTGGENYAKLATDIQIANQKAQAAATGTLLSTAGALGAAYIGGPAAATPAAVNSVANGYTQANGGGYDASQSAGPGPYVFPDSTTPSAGSTANLAPSDQPLDPYQATLKDSYANGLYYRSPSNSVGQR